MGRGLEEQQGTEECCWSAGGATGDVKPCQAPQAVTPSLLPADYLLHTLQEMLL